MRELNAFQLQMFVSSAVPLRLRGRYSWKSECATNIFYWNKFKKLLIRTTSLGWETKEDFSAGDICSNCLCWTKQQPSYLTVTQQMFIFSFHETTIVFQRFSSYGVCRKILTVTNCLDSHWISDVNIPSHVATNDLRYELQNSDQFRCLCWILKLNKGTMREEACYSHEQYFTIITRKCHAIPNSVSSITCPIKLYCCDVCCFTSFFLCLLL
jgi:hypothetical protein